MVAIFCADDCLTLILPIGLALLGLLLLELLILLGESSFKNNSLSLLIFLSKIF